ncbi:MAG: hypothetical protein JSS30_06945 [Verrucomicrobia bacterium]|nr:hypothetical protein [Verrucomicrobiota bacterium]
MSAVAVESNTNFIQRNLIPEESRNVRYAMQKAAHFGSSSHPFVSHVVSVAFAVMAVVMSAFNAISYLLQAPIKILLNIVQFNPVAVFTDFAMDIGDLAKSLLFVSLGVTLVVAGFLFPGPIFNEFSPEYYEPLEVRLEQQLEQAKAKYEELEEKYHKLQELNARRLDIERYNEGQIEELNKEIEWWRKLNPLRWLRKG